MADPLRALRLRTPRLELRLPTEPELRELAEVARRGVHPPDRMPFRVPWTEGARDEGFVEAFCGYHRAQLTTWTPVDWHLELVVFLGGDPVGAQGVFARDYAATRTAATGSWLGRPFQDRGLGTEMRAAVLELLFRGLDAEAAVTAAFADNVQSQRVSEKLGYRRDGEELEPRHEYRYRLERERWRSPVPVELEGVEAARPLFGR